MTAKKPATVEHVVRKHLRREIDIIAHSSDKDLDEHLDAFGESLIGYFDTLSPVNIKLAKRELRRIAQMIEARDDFARRAEKGTRDAEGS